ncbi:MAG TPA: malectin domain-containing carbohydrate-binding protein, partial [Chitinophagaceae bacterium]|nr:malectin domain-containing carbohydrate-binding protein [Chitinophagaceae bacterium]
SKKPFVYIAGKHWLNRIGLRNNKTDQVIISLTVYSNQKKLMLYQDGIELGYIESGNGKFKWDVNVSDGENRFVCQTLDGIYSDVIKINYSLIDTTTFSANANWYQLNFNTGQSRTYFTDTKSDEQWIPDKPYTKGTWGYVGGKIWNTWPSSAWNGIREGIHKPIRNTDNEPLFQTFVEGLISWKADLPLGKYRVTILLSEPFTHSQRKDTGRVFNIKLNGELWMQELNLEKEFGLQTAVSLDKIVDISKGEALNIEFESSSGKTILNGVSIRKL